MRTTAMERKKKICFFYVSYVQRYKWNMYAPIIHRYNETLVQQRSWCKTRLAK